MKNAVCPAVPVLRVKRCLTTKSPARRALLCLLFSMTFAFSVYATPSLNIGGSTVASSPSGVVSFSGTVNGFAITVTGITNPAIGSTTNPMLDQLTTSVTNNGNATGTITILFSEIGYGPVSGVPEADFSASVNGGSVTYQTFADPTNTLYGMVMPLTSQTVAGTFGNTSATGPAVPFNPFSLTESLSITLAPGAQYSGTEELSFVAVPEAGTSALLLFGLALVGAPLFLRKSFR